MRLVVVVVMLTCVLMAGCLRFPSGSANAINIFCGGSGAGLVHVDSNDVYERAPAFAEGLDLALNHSSSADFHGALVRAEDAFPYLGSIAVNRTGESVEWRGSSCGWVFFAE